METIEIENNIKIFKGITEQKLKYEVTAFNKYFDVIESVGAENIKEARKMMRLFFKHYNAKCVTISKIVERWYLDEVNSK
jgi:phosphosulfolactate synthase (CoM biosynthesis protein A)